MNKTKLPIFACSCKGNFSILLSTAEGLHMWQRLCARGHEGSGTKIIFGLWRALCETLESYEQCRALHSLKPLGKCGVIGGAQAVSWDRLGLNLSSTTFLAGQLWTSYLTSLSKTGGKKRCAEILTHKNKVKMNSCEMPCTVPGRWQVFRKYKFLSFAFLQVHHK